MTGDRIQALRKGLWFTPQELAGLVGVHWTSVYRWEAAGAASRRLYPFQDQLLEYLEGRFTRREDRQRWAERIRQALRSRGPLAALAVALEDLIRAI